MTLVEIRVITVTGVIVAGTVMTGSGVRVMQPVTGTAALNEAEQKDQSSSRFHPSTCNLMIHMNFCEPQFPSRPGRIRGREEDFQTIPHPIPCT